MIRVRTGALRALENPRMLGRGSIGLLANVSGTLPDLGEPRQSVAFLQPTRTETR